MATIHISALATKGEIKAAGSVSGIAPILQRRLAALTGVNAGFTDFGSGNGESAGVTFAGMQKLKSEQSSRLAVRRGEEERAARYLAQMINPEVEGEVASGQTEAEVGINISEVQG
jgi:hypothetical protein